MELFYFFTILVLIIFFINKRFSILLLVLGGMFFLINLPSTGLDYDVYKLSYESSFMGNEFPFFSTESKLVSEPLYLFYTSLVRCLTGLSFSQFLAFNFLICFYISYLAFKNISLNLFFYFWLLFLPIFFPTVFYFSPRSSLSFFMVMFGFLTTIKSKRKDNHARNLIRGLIFMFIGMMIHSQFIPIVLYVCFISFFCIHLKSNFKVYRNKILIISISIFLILKFSLSFLSYFESFLSLLPSSKLAVNKLHYLEDARKGFRLSGLFSIFVYPIMSFIIMKYFFKQRSFIGDRDLNRFKTLTMFLFGIAMFGAAVNLAFIDTPHLAGRLVRFSDYFCFSVAIPLILKIRYNNKLDLVILIALFLLIPIVFPAVYHNTIWGF
ncbi:EpsG family protein [Tenacibaculum sp. MAR_2009_124]|uniref:EpsG family protein n=1 Tax=Tenacibaculum sp. MAR_2009_124 TaxID=1250059 RepID=UPI00089C8CB6|nr:EpsG family protein [Tenacibaculum sp. MAR_2009_124]SEB69671.1 EpsG family protein [Tenacibaculum sp. MAR_2009_124]